MLGAKGSVAVQAPSIADKARELRDVLDHAGALISGLQSDLGLVKKDAFALLEQLAKEAGVEALSRTDVEAFFREPYVIWPRSEKEWVLAVPKFVSFSYGWLWRQTDSYNLFVINRYTDWITPLPPSLRQQLGLLPPDGQYTIDRGYLNVPVGREREVLRKFKEHLKDISAPGVLRITQGHQFSLTAALVREGFLPFAPKPIDPQDLRQPSGKVKLWDDELPAWEAFKKYGATGVFWPPGSGKTYFGLWLCDVLKGDKLLVVPTLTLKEQWEQRLRDHVQNPYEVTVVTYQGASRAWNNSWRRGRPFTLCLWDEVQHLPADVFGRLANVPTKYRVGLSATPIREDGRSDLVFSLTGFPVGLDWSKLIKSGRIQNPTAVVHVVPKEGVKLQLLQSILSKAPTRRLIFCDSLDYGRRVARELKVPFVSGEMKHGRMDTISNHETCVVSRVGDEGLDLPDLKAVIEVDFHFGSRRQELQRFGRLLHSRFKGQYHVLMTKDEYEDHKKRLLGLYERGFRVVIVQE